MRFWSSWTGKVAQREQAVSVGRDGTKVAGVANRREGPVECQSQGDVRFTSASEKVYNFLVLKMGSRTICFEAPIFSISLPGPSASQSYRSDHGLRRRLGGRRLRGGAGGGGAAAAGGAAKDSADDGTEQRLQGCQGENLGRQVT